MTNDKFDADLKSHRRFGLLAFMLLFGFGGIWATSAPIDGAAIATGIVTVKSYSKVVQHLEGGIIKDIFVENGAMVEANQPILEIDNTQSLTELEAQNQRLLSLRTWETRLEAERDGRDTLVYPSSFDLLGERAREDMDGQIQIFNARRSARAGSIEILEQRIEQLQSQIRGYRGLQASKEKLTASYNEELVDIGELLSQGFSDKNRLRELERNVSVLEGEIAELTATIGSTEVAIGEARLQILQEEKEFQNDVVSELRDVQTEINVGVEVATALEDVVSRTIVRAPDSGIVNGLQFHTIAGVIAPGMKILDIDSEDQMNLYFQTKKRKILPRSQNQKNYFQLLNSKDIVFAYGPAGTGKTFLAVAKAVASLQQGLVKKIILSRPAVEAGEKLGFLPGDLKEKVDPFLRPIYDALYEMMPYDQVEKKLANNTIEIAPIAFMRGRTLEDCYIILDEAQNTTKIQMKMFLTRLGKNSKMVVVGDNTQIDLISKNESGLIEASIKLKNIDDIGFIELDQRDVIRHEVVRKIINVYEDKNSN